ncbi:hypothetical protein CHARACLAT_029831 [Characodon lateralis]|uniref:Uncharacterized protein n=1 Tax=Characodon lateralis TaxID=208331 RepID=A0ABU7DVB5_9TELE|nr:hypothetical protein [Characodon lateralis]
MWLKLFSLPNVQQCCRSSSSHSHLGPHKPAFCHVYPLKQKQQLCCTVCRNGSAVWNNNIEDEISSVTVWEFFGNNWDRVTFHISLNEPSDSQLNTCSPTCVCVCFKPC